MGRQELAVSCSRALSRGVSADELVVIDHSSEVRVPFKGSLSFYDGYVIAGETFVRVGSADWQRIESDPDCVVVLRVPSGWIEDRRFSTPAATIAVAGSAVLNLRRYEKLVSLRELRSAGAEYL